MILCSHAQQRPALGIGNCSFNRTNAESAHLEALYLDVIKKIVLGVIYTEWQGFLQGNAHPTGETGATTMIGLRRLNNLQFLLEETIRLNVPGDFIETGVWRGGATILAAAIFQAYGQTCPSAYCRRVFVADSFQGIPPVNLNQFPSDAAHVGSDQMPILQDNSQARVAASFQKLGLLNSESIVWLEGWFKDTLPQARKEGILSKIAVMRLDGDTYESTWQALVELYDLVSEGGFIIVDDYQDWVGCRKAVNDFLSARQISVKLRPVAHEPGEEFIRGIWWQK